MSTACVWRAYGLDFDVDEYLSIRSGLVVDARWHRGEKDLLGRPSDTSGFNVALAEAVTPALAIKALEAFPRFDELLSAASRAGATQELDFSVELSPDRPMRSIRFTAEDLAYCSHRSLAVVVSSYASIDDDD